MIPPELLLEVQERERVKTYSGAIHTLAYLLDVATQDKMELWRALLAEMLSRNKERRDAGLPFDPWRVKS